MKRISKFALGGTAGMTLVGALVISKSVVSTKKEKSSKSSRPNIILVIVDDQMISSLEVMPTIRAQLVDRGITFTNSFCASPICAPSRASILTGQYVHNHGEDTNAARRFVNQRDRSDTMSTILKEGDYNTVLIGKYTHGYDNASYVPPGWDEWYAFVGRPNYYNYRMSVNGELRGYGNNSADYSTDVIARMASSYIERHARSDRPFFMYLAPNAPHAPSQPAIRHKKQLTYMRIPRPLHEKDVSDKPRWLVDNRKLNKRNRRKTMQEGMLMGAIRKLETLLAVDEMLERIINALDNCGKSSSTYIFYLADNGDDYNRHTLSSAKLLPYEEGIRTPIIVRGPRIEYAVRREHVVSAIDLLPTIAELARLPMPVFADGRSLAPLFSCPPMPLSEWRKACLVEVGGVKEWFLLSPPPAYRLIRTRDIKYIEYDSGEREYYDLRLDPDELINDYEHLQEKRKRELHLQMQQMIKSRT